MKKSLLSYILFLAFIIQSYSQIQIGDDIYGDMFQDFFGSTISISSDGNILAIGAPFSDENGHNSGLVKVFRNNSGVWEQIGNNLHGTNNGNAFGQALSLSSDGNILAISETFSNKGYVKIYKNTSGTWTQIGNDLNGVFGDSFGASLDLSLDGSIIAVGAPSANNYNSGQVRVFKNNSDTWTQVGQSINGNVEQGNLGRSVSLSSDGNILAVGIPNISEDGTYSGQVKVFRNNSGTWEQVGDNINGVNTGDKFGTNLDLSATGDVIAIGSPFNDDNEEDSGQVTVFKENAGKWEVFGNKLNGDKSSDLFGSVVSLSSDGNILAIGAPYNTTNGSASGQVKTFKRNSLIWEQVGNDIIGDSSTDRLGTSLSLSSDGKVLAIGAPYHNGNASKSGQVKVFNLFNTLSLGSVNKENTFIAFLTGDRTKLQIKTNLNFKKVSVFSNLGKKVIESNNKIINVSYLPNGVYFLNIETNQGFITKKIIK